MRTLSLAVLLSVVTSALAAADIELQVGANAAGVVLSGVIVTPGTTDAQPMLIEVTGVRVGGELTSSRFRIIAEARANGAEHVSVTLQKASWVSADNQPHSIDIQGYAVDAVTGAQGLSGKFSSNADQFALIQIKATAQKALTTDPAEQAVINSMAERLAKEIKPTLTVPNGLAVSLVFTDKATLTGLPVTVGSNAPAAAVNGNIASGPMNQVEDAITRNLAEQKASSGDKTAPVAR